MNKLKIKITVGKIGKYLRDFSIVVAGIAVTLWVQSWLDNRSERKDIRLYLNAIKLELEDNMKDVDVITARMEEEVAYSRYLMSHDKKLLNADTIQRYREAIYRITLILPSVSAFEMFKNSGNMRLISDKELLRDIWDSYISVELFRQTMEMYYKDKQADRDKEFRMMKDGKPIDAPMYDFYTFEYSSGILWHCTNAKQALKEIISKLEKDSHF